MKTYQDLVAVGEDESKRIEFVKEVIAQHRNSKEYKDAEIAEAYFAGENVTITNFTKFLYDAFGRKVLDVWSPNHKIACKYYGYLVVQLAMFLAGNGVSFGDSATKDKLGEDFDVTLVELLLDALNDRVSFAFVDKDKVVPFTLLEFAPLYDEDTGALRAGVRWWQLDSDKPLRCTLYEEDGFTDYRQPNGQDMQVMKEKRPYIEVVATSEVSVEDEEIVDGMNYPTFPIVPLYNYRKRSELDGNREAIDALDLMVSQLINNVDAGEAVYWLFKNSGGMDQAELNEYIQTLKTSHAAAVDGEGDITAHSPDVKFQASHEAIEQLRRQIFDNQMGLDVRNIAGGAATATQIKAAYEPLNTKADLLEMQLVKFVRGILAVLGIDDKPTFTRSYIINQSEAVQTIVTAGAELPQEYKTRKILEILGDIDKADEALEQLTAEDANRFTNTVPEV